METEHQETEYYAEVQWVAPDQSVMVEVVSFHDENNSERYALVTSTPEASVVLAQFHPSVTYDVLASVIVLLQVDSSPRISDRLNALLTSVFPVDTVGPKPTIIGDN